MKKRGFLICVSDMRNPRMEYQESFSMTLGIRAQAALLLVCS
ncbi:hypothetical protein EM6_0012 [Asticcacaulis excentricus]|uniref:Uncharacterized protein n=1 Tax=Asticcacaulis excentricus TaxID=78587 RepID=A0A3G9G5E9_9CAUL|nr:hypothetical protein EM6_0012 [Asticcacaulis excentricus]